jgi:Rps23 Pro-64 3,4-dihydroxylase Tpa1-like proline 4-hydroxylase
MEACSAAAASEAPASASTETGVLPVKQIVIFAPLSMQSTQSFHQGHFQKPQENRQNQSLILEAKLLGWP